MKDICGTPSAKNLSKNTTSFIEKSIFHELLVKKRSNRDNFEGNFMIYKSSYIHFLPILLLEAKIQANVLKNRFHHQFITN